VTQDESYLVVTLTYMCPIVAVKDRNGGSGNTRNPRT